MCSLVVWKTRARVQSYRHGHLEVLGIVDMAAARRVAILYHSYPRVYLADEFVVDDQEHERVWFRCPRLWSLVAHDRSCLWGQQFPWALCYYRPGLQQHLLDGPKALSSALEYSRWTVGEEIASLLKEPHQIGVVFRRSLCLLQSLLLMQQPLTL